MKPEKLPHFQSADDVIMSSFVIFWLTPPSPSSDDVIYEQHLIRFWKRYFLFNVWISDSDRWMVHSWSFTFLQTVRTSGSIGLAILRNVTFVHWQSSSNTDRESNWIGLRGSIKSCNKSPQSKSVKLWSMQKDCKKLQTVDKTWIFHSGKCRTSLISAQLLNLEILAKHVPWSIGNLFTIA